MKILSSMMIMITITTLILLMTMKLSKKTKLSREKNSPFECGFNPNSSPRMNISIHFFLIAIMFIIFDMEISIILPMMNNKMMKMNEWILTSTIIMMMLIIGLMHEWNNNMLEWSK